MARARSPRRDVRSDGPGRTSSPRRATSRVALAMITTAGVAMLSVGTAAGASRADALASVEGRVVAKSTGRPVAGAVVVLPDLGARTLSARDGRFAFPDRFPASSPYRPIGAVVMAGGFGRLTIRDVPLIPGDTLRLHVELSARPQAHTVARPHRRGDEPTDSTRHTGTCTGWTAQLVPPQSIRVLRTATGVVEEPDFRFYVQHVLPNEWIASWDGDALGAGAIAAKTYGWYHAKPNHAYSSGPGCADVQDDTHDQVYDPTWSTAATDQAVNASFGSTLWRDGGIFESQYWSGAKGDPCAPVTTGTYAGRMSQW